MRWQEIKRCTVLLVVLVMGALGSSARGQNATPLVKGTAYPGELAAADRHVYTLALAADQFVYGEADQQTVDVVVTVFDPAGREVGTFDSPARGPEPFRFTAKDAGAYRVEVAPFEEATGRYVLTVLRVEPVADTPERRVDQMMVAYDRSDMPGGVVAVVRAGEVTFVRGYGMANLEYQVPNSPETVYHMASVSKQFTAFAIALLAEQGRLSLDDDVRKHVSEVPDLGHSVTLRHLLHHTSGLRDHWNLWVMAGGLMDDVIRQGDLLRLVERQRKLNFEPGTEYLYSNTGYMLLAEVVARVTGEPFGDWMRTQIFEPLDMWSTQIYDDHERLVPGRSYSYQYGEEGISKSVLSYANAGATSLFTTAPDLAKWLRNFRTAEVGGPGVQARMLERGVLVGGDTLEYALGIGIGEYRGLRRIQHGGADAGYRTALAYYPDIDAGVIVLSNLSSFDTGSIARETADVFFAEELAPEEEALPPVLQEPAEPAGVAVASEVLARYTGSFEVENGPVVRFMHEGDRLFAEVVGQPRLALVALSDTLFQLGAPGANIRIGFHAETDGSVDRGTLYQNIETPLRRVVPWEPSAEERSAYLGRYYSPELETFYAVVEEGDRLVLRHRRHGDLEMDASKPGIFSVDQWFIGEVAFERSGTGAVTGMRMTNGRVRRLLFEKQ